MSKRAVENTPIVRTTLAKVLEPNIGAISEPVGLKVAHAPLLVTKVGERNFIACSVYPLDGDNFWKYVRESTPVPGQGRFGALADWKLGGTLVEFHRDILGLKGAWVDYFDNHNEAFIKAIELERGIASYTVGEMRLTTSEKARADFLNAHHSAHKGILRVEEGPVGDFARGFRNVIDEPKKKRAIAVKNFGRLPKEVRRGMLGEYMDEVDEPTNQAVLERYISQHTGTGATVLDRKKIIHCGRTLEEYQPSSVDFIEADRISVRLANGVQIEGYIDDKNGEQTVTPLNDTLVSMVSIFPTLRWGYADTGERVIDTSSIARDLAALLQKEIPNHLYTGILNNSRLNSAAGLALPAYVLKLRNDWITMQKGRYMEEAQAPVVWMQERQSIATRDDFFKPLEAQVT